MKKLSKLFYLIFVLLSTNAFPETITCPDASSFTKKQIYNFGIFPSLQWKLVPNSKIFNLESQSASRNETISAESQLDIYIRYSNIIRCSYHVNSNNKTLEVTNEKSNMNINFDTQKLDATVWKKNNAGEYVCTTKAGDPAACTIPYFNF